MTPLAFLSWNDTQRFLTNTGLLVRGYNAPVQGVFWSPLFVLNLTDVATAGGKIASMAMTEQRSFAAMVSGGGVARGVYVYRHTDDFGVATVAAPDPDVSGGSFGQSMDALENTTTHEALVAVGVTGADTPVGTTGVVELFKCVENETVFWKTIRPQDLEPSFGQSVSLHSVRPDVTYLAVGSPLEGYGGCVSIFALNDVDVTLWRKYCGATVHPMIQSLGKLVLIDRNSPAMLASAYNLDTGNNVVLLLNFMPGFESWTLESVLLELKSEPTFGSSMSISWPEFAVGSPGSGIVHVFHHDKDEWRWRYTNISSSNDDKEFGTSVCVKDVVVAVGSPGVGDTGSIDIINLDALQSDIALVIFLAACLFAVTVPIVVIVVWVVFQRRRVPAPVVLQQN
eukprot:TRINITY_DN1058_c0_g1_i3.p1 TRINITY_DN1058_c0_g1~~TRINITY_DN1058_c0_g1_i3.p1  ORF type:complete len:397 (+),score=66.45 TRINITY_DN1058_c0_g1_i3:92-1282(+)